MSIVFNANFYTDGDQYRSVDFKAVEDATAAVEAAGAGSITKFVVHAGVLGSDQYVSLAHFVYQDGKWKQWSIHGPVSTDLGEKRPE